MPGDQLAVADAVVRMQCARVDAIWIRSLDARGRRNRLGIRRQ